MNLPASFVRLFMPAFADLVESGQKCQTVRPTPKRMPMPGDRISLRTWTGRPYRSKQRILREAVITNVVPIAIVPEGWVWIHEMRIKTRREFEAFAKADGFESPEAMLAWFRETHGLPFDGGQGRQVYSAWGRTARYRVNEKNHAGALQKIEHLHARLGHFQKLTRTLAPGTQAADNFQTYTVIPRMRITTADHPQV